MPALETRSVPPTPYPTGKFWWFRNGDNWHAPLINNGAPYLPDVKAQWLRDFYWACRNPIGNFVGFVIGFEGTGYTVTGDAPVMLTTGRDGNPQIFGWRKSVINGWAPYWSYWGPPWFGDYYPFKNYQIEFYFGWRPSSGGFGLKFIPHKI